MLVYTHLREKERSSVILTKPFAYCSLACIQCAEPAKSNVLHSANQALHPLHPSASTHTLGLYTNLTDRMPQIWTQLLVACPHPGDTLRIAQTLHALQRY